MNAGQPDIEVPGQPHKAFRIGRDGLDDSLVKPNPDGELYEHRPETAQRIDSMLFIESHRFLRSLLPVVLIALLDVFHQGLQLGHRLDLSTLLDSQRHERKANQQCKCDNGYPEIQERP